MKLRAIALAFALSACATVPVPPDAAQAVYALESTLTTAVQVATVYAQLPRCAPGGVALCSNAAIVSDINAAAQSAGTAVEAAQSVVTSGTASAAAQQQALASAQTAVNALTALTAKVKTTP